MRPRRHSGTWHYFALALALALAAHARAESDAAAEGPDASGSPDASDASDKSDAGFELAALPDPQDALERLYGRKQLDFQHGAPTVTVRLMEGQSHVTFSPVGRMRLLARGQEALEGAANSTWTVRLKKYEPGEVSWSIRVAELRYADKAGLAETRALWEQRGLAVGDVVAGSLYGIAGKVLDNRHHEIYVGPPQSEAAAKQLLTDLHARFGLQGALEAKLTRRPHGLIEVVDERGVVVATAEDLVSVSSPDAGPFRVKQVEHGMGYSWHGFQDRTYRGELAFVVDKSGGLAVVNTVPLESYLRGIVPSEIYAKAHPEALKAQAVTARGDVLAKIGTRHLTDPYLLCAEQHCQVYTGLSAEVPSTDAAVAATAGEALFARKSKVLVNSVYSAVCGGHTENNDAVWGGPPDPSLRGKPDLVWTPPAFAKGINAKNLDGFLKTNARSYCSISSFAKAAKYRWERRFTKEKVDALLASYGVGRVVAMSVAERGVSGRAVALSVSGEDGATQVRGELVIRRLFENLNSAMFALEPPGPAHPDEWVFRGGGWGHGAGMCQVGAIGRAERGQTYRQILRHYFNGAEVARIY